MADPKLQLEILLKRIELLERRMAVLDLKHDMLMARKETLRRDQIECLQETKTWREQVLQQIDLFRQEVKDLDHGRL